MTSLTWKGHRFESCATLPLTDRGFRYGMAIFETIRISNGIPEFLEGHWNRLRAACAERSFPLEEESLERAAEALHRPGFEGVARFYITAGVGGVADPVKETGVYLLLEERKTERAKSYDLIIEEDTYRPAFSGLKTANYWFNADVMARARSRKADEALLFNDLGELVSACMANVFLVIGEQMLTPSKATGCRTGVVRDWVIKRRNVAEKRLRREHCLQADEIFLTSSWLGIMPVSTLEGRPLGPRSFAPKLQGELERKFAGLDS